MLSFPDGRDRSRTDRARSLGGGADPESQVLAPGRGDDLHAERQNSRGRDRRGDRRQAGERERLRIDPEMAGRRQAGAVDLYPALANRERGIGRRRRQDHIDVLESVRELSAPRAAKALNSLARRGARELRRARRRDGFVIPAKMLMRDYAIRFLCS
jgi:hypothetical protein